MMHPGRTRRLALTLLEVVLALAILAGSFATLAQLVGLGMRAAGNGRDLTTAQLLAESTLSEVTAGILPTENLNRVPIDTHPGWLVSAIVDNTPYQGILRVTVITERETESYRRVDYQLTRWIRDPNLALPTDEEEAPDDSSDTSAATNNSSSSNGANNSASGNAANANASQGNAAQGNAPRGNTQGGNAPRGNRSPGNAPSGNRPQGNGTGGGRPTGGAQGGRPTGPGGRGP